LLNSLLSNLEITNVRVSDSTWTIHMVMPSTK
jgi:hypothetical protein